MDDLARGWGRYWLELSDIRVDSAIELQQRDSEGEWIRREPEIGEYIFARSSEDVAEINHRFESAKPLRRANTPRIIRAKVSNPNCRHEIFEGIPGDNSPYSTEDLDRVTPTLVEIYEDQSSTDDLELAKRGFLLRDDDGSAFFVFRLATEEFDNALQLLLQPNTKFHMECSLNGWIGFTEGGGQVVCLDSKTGNSRAELFNLGANRVVTDSPDTHADQKLDHHQEMSDLEGWIVQAIAELERRLESSQKHLSSIQIASWITAIAITLFVITFLI